MDRRLPVFLILLVGCAPPNGGGTGEGPGHRSQRLALSPQQEYELGVKAYHEVLQEAEQKNALIRSGPAVRRVSDVGMKIANVATGNSRMSQLLRREINLHIEGYRFDWEFAVIRSNQVNAFCLPGGKVAVFTGLLQLIDQNRGGDDWLATVLGHEIAHALAHHGSERIAREEMTERAARVVGAGIGAISPEERDRLLKVLSVGGRFGSLPFDRRQESEADHIGVFLMAFAGYDPHAAVKFWEAMTARGGEAHVPEILSDHPSDARRIAQLRVWADKAAAAVQAYQSGNTVDAPR